MEQYLAFWLKEEVEINLKPLKELKIGAQDLIRRLQPELVKFPGITLYLQPVLHNPIGHSMSAARRAEITKLAAKLDMFLIEDLVYGFLSDAEGGLRQLVHSLLQLAGGVVQPCRRL